MGESIISGNATPRASTLKQLLGTCHLNTCAITYLLLLLLLLVCLQHHCCAAGQLPGC
jgi:hypothetical protein